VITKLIEDPAACSTSNCPTDRDVLITVGLALKAALIEHRHNLPLTDDARIDTAAEIGDIVFQLAVAGEVFF
jgi:hypothetical protein